MSTSTLVSIFDGLKTQVLDAVAGIAPIALTVAGAILVIVVGWRLFRRFLGR
jgi:hypothetical protein